MGSRLLLLCAVLQALACTAQAGDLARERRIWEELDSTARQGEAVTLKTGELEFLALHSAARTAHTLGAVILLHDRGANPDWREVIHPLRSHLPDHGWETLSIQLPLDAVDATPESYEKLIPEAFPRLAFAVDFLSQRRILNIVLVGHGLGGRTALQWLAQEIPEPVQACVVIGLTAERPDIEPGTLNALSRIQLPVLDLYGSRDLGMVLHTAPQRATAARKAENTRYRQLVIEGADHFFTGLQDQLVSRVRAWLARQAGGVEKNL